MAAEEPKVDEQLNIPDKMEEKADKVDDKVEVTESQVEAADETSDNKDDETPETNVGDQPATADEGATDKTKEEPAAPSFPRTLIEFGYKFNDNGQLRQVESDEPFVFKVKDSDQQYNQAHYEALGEVITEHIYQLLEFDAKLTRTDIPVDVKSDEAHSFIFESQDARTADKLMVLIHGTGVVRAGQWARRLIINDCLDSGTQLPFIKRSVENSYGVIVLNTNRNTDIINGEAQPVRGSESAEEHTIYVWDHVISKCEAKRIDIVAHSYGGVAVLDLLVRRFNEVKSKVELVAFTDSAHSLPRQCSNQTEIAPWLAEHAVNWVSCDEPLDKVVAYATDDAGRLSAGTKKHEETSWYSINSIFKFFAGEVDYIKAVMKPEEPVSKPEEPVTKVEEEPVTKSEEEPVTNTEEVAAKSEEILKSEEPVSKNQEPAPTDKDIDKRVEESGHHLTATKSTDSCPPTEDIKSGCCIVI